MLSMCCLETGKTLKDGANTNARFAKVISRQTRTTAPIVEHYWTEKGKTMSILINGIDMPKNCYACPFGMEYYSTLWMAKGSKFRKDYSCVITHKALTSTKRNRFCPLEEVHLHEGGERAGDFDEPEINPCRGCPDYDGRGGCISNGGCGERKDDE